MSPHVWPPADEAEAAHSARHRQLAGEALPARSGGRELHGAWSEQAFGPAQEQIRGARRKHSSTVAGLSRSLGLLREALSAGAPGGSLLPREHVAIVDVAGLPLGAIPSMRRRNLTPDEIPLLVQECFILSEDRRFWSHHGIDGLACARAVVMNLRRGRIHQGGSTITQQLVKNLFLMHLPRWQRKPIEAIAALLLERQVPKPVILASYLNTIYFGGRTFGVAEAARGYYNKDVGDLTAAEVVVLASVVRAPNFYLSANGRAHLLRRAQRLLNRLHTNVEFGARVAPRLPRPSRKRRAARRRRGMERQALLGLARSLMSQRDPAAARRGVSEIRVAADVRLQHRVCAVLAGAGTRDGQAAAVALRIEDRAVLAAAALPYGLEFPIRGRVQPGSSLKPFVLATALEGGYRLSDRFRSEETTVEFPDGTRWCVRNHDGRYHGEIDLCTALALSDNTVFAKLIGKLSLAEVGAMLGKFGVQVERITPAVALGAVRGGVEPLQLLNAYATIAARGAYRPVRYVLGTRDRHGNEKGVEKAPATQITSAAVAKDLAFALRFAASLGPAAIPVANLAAKTGTSERDHVVCAFRDDVAALVWLGRPHGIHEVEKGYSPSRLLQQLANVLFDVPA